MNMPFGFGDFGAGQLSRRAPVGGAQAEKKATPWWKRTVGDIKWAARNSGTDGSMLPLAALLGIPMYQKRGGQWMTFNPRIRSIYQTGTTPFGVGLRGGGGGGGNDPGTGGEDPGTGGDGSGNGGGGVGSTSWIPPQLLYPPPIGTGVQWRNTMKYGA